MTGDDRAHALCDLLLGAAYADDHFHEREKAFVRGHLVALCGGELPRDLAERIEGFDPSHFDVERSAAVFSSDSKSQKRDLLELIASLHQADDELDLAEDDYLRSVARALGADSELGGLTLDYESKSLSQSFTRLRAMPPPPPER